MKKPKLELKRIKTFQGMEGYGLNADLYINGVKCLIVIDEGNGGCFIYRNIYSIKDETKAKRYIAQLEEYIKNHEPIVFDWGSVPYDMDMLVDDVLAEQEERKARKKMEKEISKLQETSLIFGNPDTFKFAYYNYKRKLSEIPKDLLKTKISFIERNQ
jgi:hypothetical protein